MLGRIAGIGRGLAHNAASGLQRFPIPALLIVAFSVASNLEAVQSMVSTVRSYF